MRAWFSLTNVLHFVGHLSNLPACLSPLLRVTSAIFPPCSNIQEPRLIYQASSVRDLRHPCQRDSWLNTSCRRCSTIPNSSS